MHISMSDFVMAGTPIMIGALIVSVFYIIVGWKILTKAGLPGWGSLVPIYNTILYLKVAGKEWWWLFLLCIPFVNFVIAIMVIIAMAKNFGKSTGFAMGMLFLGPIFYPILAFDSSEFKPV